VLIKPHASSNARFREEVEGALRASGLTVVRAGEYTGKQLHEAGTVDAHYGTLRVGPLALERDLPAESLAKFEATFGVAWRKAADEGKLVNLQRAIQVRLIKDLDAFASAWRSGTTLKLAPGTYVGAVDGLLVVNGFYGNMRNKFLEPDARTAYYLVRWEEEALPWARFRAEVVGATDPAKADPRSLRAKLLASWREWGMAVEPNSTFNGVHASASALEGSREINIWTPLATAETSLYRVAVKLGVDVRGELPKWLKNQRVGTADGSAEGLAFDLCEDKGTEAVLTLIPKLPDAGVTKVQCCVVL